MVEFSTPGTTEKARCALSVQLILQQLSDECAEKDLYELAHLLDVGALQASDELSALLGRLPPEAKSELVAEQVSATSTH